VIRGSRAERVECRFGGDHAAYSARLRLQAGRYSDAGNACQLGRDEAARYWMGEPSDHDHDHALLPGRDPLLLTMDHMAFKAVDDRAHRLVAYITLVRCPDGAYDMGGVVHAAVRGHGYGREALETVCRLAHHHFGIATLLAMCEPANVASARWLASCHFVQVGPAREFELPNGRRTHMLRWQRVEPAARWRCGNFPETPPW
jgi:RimJ/RimL family protein N-acetyltransferase